MGNSSQSEESAAREQLVNFRMEMTRCEEIDSGLPISGMLVGEGVGSIPRLTPTIDEHNVCTTCTAVLIGRLDV